MTSHAGMRVWIRIVLLEFSYLSYMLLHFEQYDYFNKVKLNKFCCFYLLLNRQGIIVACHSVTLG